MAGGRRRMTVSCEAPLDAHHADALPQQTRPGLHSSGRLACDASTVKPKRAHDSAMEPLRRPAVVSAEFGSQAAASNLCRVALARGEPLCVSFPMNVRCSVTADPAERRSDAPSSVLRRRSPGNDQENNGDKARTPATRPRSTPARSTSGTRSTAEESGNQGATTAPQACRCRTAPPNCRRSSSRQEIGRDRAGRAVGHLPSSPSSISQRRSSFPSPWRSWSAPCCRRRRPSSSASKFRVRSDRC